MDTNVPFSGEDEPLLAAECISSEQPPNTFTFRSTIIGFALGTVVLVSNLYFGLQTGMADFMAVPSATLGFLIFSCMGQPSRTHFTPQENTYLQTVSGAVGIVPFASGMISAIAGLQFVLPPEDGGFIELDTLRLTTWSLGLAFFGIFFGLAFRKQVLEHENLQFPSATVAASIITRLHQGEELEVATDTMEYQHMPLDMSHAETVNQQASELTRTSVTNALAAFVGAASLVRFSPGVLYSH